MNNTFKIFSILAILVMVSSGFLVLFTNDFNVNNVHYNSTKRILNANPETNVTELHRVLPFYVDYMIPVTNEDVLYFNSTDFSFGGGGYLTIDMYNFSTNSITEYESIGQSVYNANICIFPAVFNGNFYFSVDHWDSSGGSSYICNLNLSTGKFTNVGATNVNTAQALNTFVPIKYMFCNDKYLYITQYPDIVVYNMSNDGITVENLTTKGFNPSGSKPYGILLVYNYILSYSTSTETIFYVYYKTFDSIFTTSPINAYSYPLITLSNNVINLTFHTNGYLFNVINNTYKNINGNPNLPLSAGNISYYLPYSIYSVLLSRSYTQTFTYCTPLQYKSSISEFFPFTEVSKYHYLVGYMLDPGVSNQLLCVNVQLYSYKLTITSYEAGNLINNYGLVNGNLYSGNFSKIVTLPFTYLPLNFSNYVYNGSLITLTTKNFPGNNTVKYYNLTIYYMSSGSAIQPLNTNTYLLPLTYFFVLLLIPAFTIFVYKFRRELKHIKGVKYGI